MILILILILVIIIVVTITTPRGPATGAPPRKRPRLLYRISVYHIILYCISLYDIIL